jgi:hypothetical protein
MNNEARKPFAVFTSAALCVSLLLSPSASIVSAEEAAVKLTFPDISAQHWARSHVAKLAASGIVKGYTTGQYMPGNLVTQQEAVVMAIRMLGLEDEALADQRAVVLGFEVDSFFRPYVVKALESRILNLAEETEAAVQGGTAWGKRPASREWVAKMVVRAVGDTPLSTGKPLTFSDAAEVSAQAAPFVGKSQELGLVTGFTDSTFKPKETVTRAQIATILSRADQYIPNDAQRDVSGIVTGRAGATLQLRTASGEVVTFGLQTETLVFDEEGKALALAEVTDLKSIRVIHKNRQAYYIEVSNQAVTAESIDGEVTAVDMTGMTISVETAAGGLQNYKLAANATVMNAQGSGISLSQVTEGSEVRLQRLQGAAEISSVTVVEAAYNATGTAVAEAINTQERTVSFRGANGSVVTYPVDANAKLSVKGEAPATLGGLQLGDTFAYEIKDSVLVSIDITAQKYVSVSGELFNHTDDSVTILVSGTELKAYFLDKNADIVIDGLSDPVMSDLQKGDSIQLKLSGSTNRAQSIAVTNRSVTALRNVTILVFDKENNYLTIRDDKGKTQFFSISGRTQLMLDGSVLSKELYSLYLAKDRKVSLLVSSDQLIRLDIVTKLSGTVTGVNATTRTITLKGKDNVTATVPYVFAPYIEVPRQASASLSDITAGARVHLSLGAQSDAATTIQVDRSFVFTVTSVNVAAKTIFAKDSTGAAVSLQLDANTKVQTKDKQNMELATLSAGQLIVANYTGRTITSIEEATTIRGKVTSVDTVGGKLVVTDFTNNARNYDLSSGVAVVSGSTVSSSASSLRLNDRIQLIVDAQGKLHIQVAHGTVRKFSSYDATNHEISFKIAALADQGKYVIDANAYVHTASGGLLVLSRLKEHDALTVYVLDGKVIELIQ